MKFVRREVKEKSADWGELRKIKKHIIVKKGLPNIPNLVLQTDEGLSFTAILRWKKELRLYLFDAEGRMIYGHSYFESLKETYSDLKTKSKKISRFPQVEKPLSAAQINQQFDKKFQRIWTQLANKMKISKKFRRDRPLVKGVTQPRDGIYGTKLEKGFIYVPVGSTKLREIFTFYSLFFFIPPHIRSNTDIAEALSFLMLRSFKQFQEEPLIKNRSSTEIILQLAPWGTLRPTMILNILNKISQYFDSTWETQDFISFTSLPFNDVKNLSRQNLPKIFCRLFAISQNADFLLLANLLGLPFGIDCSIPVELSNNENLKLYSWMKNWQFNRILPYLEREKSVYTKGQRRALDEALMFQYANVLDLKLISAKFGEFEIFNKSDLPVILSRLIQVFPDGNEKEISFQKVGLPPQEARTISLISLKVSVDFPIRIQYQLIKSLENNLQPIFTGTLVI
ncbi:MAG: hypothetical protein ACFE8U_05515 [Candidatus Hermodarchaeota archaeon]